MEQDIVITSNVKQAVPFFGVTSMENSLKFYIDGLGCVVTLKWIDEGKLRWCWLQLGETALMLQEFKTEGDHSWKPSGKLGAGMSIAFICDDALSLYNEFLSRGVAASRPFVGNGMWVTTCIDPDGYRLEFESKTDVPEGSEFGA